MTTRGRWLVAVLVAAACGRGASSSSAAPAPGSNAPAPAKDPHVDAQPTQVTLKSPSSPTAKAGALTVTLLDLIEVAAPNAAGKVDRMFRAKLHLEVSGQARDIFLVNESTALGYTLKLHSAGDGQSNPHAPRESMVVIDIRPAA